jgi:hypothetical protein
MVHAISQCVDISLMLNCAIYQMVYIIHESAPHLQTMPQMHSYEKKNNHTSSRAVEVVCSDLKIDAAPRVLVRPP